MKFINQNLENVVGIDHKLHVKLFFTKFSRSPPQWFWLGHEIVGSRSFRQISAIKGTIFLVFEELPLRQFIKNQVFLSGTNV